MKFLLVTVMMLILSVPMAYADAKLVSAGRAQLRTVSVNSNQNYVDVESRQLRYRQSRLSFRNDLQQRRYDFARPQIVAKNRYNENLKLLNRNRQDWQGETR